MGGSRIISILDQTCCRGWWLGSAIQPYFELSGMIPCWCESSSSHARVHHSLPFCSPVPKLGGVVLFTDVNRIWSRWSRFLLQSAANWSTENWFKCLLVPRIAPQLLPFAGRQRLFRLVFRCCWFVRPPDVRPGTRYRCSPPCSPLWAFPCTPNPPLRLLLCVAIQTGGCWSAPGVSWNL